MFAGRRVRFLAGELWFGMMPDSLKALDLRRDPRFTLQANPGDGTGMGGGYNWGAGLMSLGKSLQSRPGSSQRLGSSDGVGFASSSQSASPFRVRRREDNIDVTPAIRARRPCSAPGRGSSRAG